MYINITKLYTWYKTQKKKTKLYQKMRLNSSTWKKSYNESLKINIITPRHDYDITL